MTFSYTCIIYLNHIHFLHCPLPFQWPPFLFPPSTLFHFHVFKSFLNLPVPHKFVEAVGVHYLSSHGGSTEPKQRNKGLGLFFLFLFSSTASQTECSKLAPVTSWSTCLGFLLSFCQQDQDFPHIVSWSLEAAGLKSQLPSSPSFSWWDTYILMIKTDWPGS